jgi:hypothetical protein
VEQVSGGGPQNRPHGSGRRGYGVGVIERQP